MRRFRIALVGALLTASLLAQVASPMAARADSASDAAAFVAAINALRAGHGLAPLAVDIRLTSVATWWAGQMAASGSLAQNPNLASMVPPGWTMLGENVGDGAAEPMVEAAFETSPEHLANMLQPAFSAVGVGVVWSGSTLWVTEDYMAGVPAIGPPPVTWTWTGPQLPNPPRGIVGNPAVTTWGVNRFDEFVKGADNQLWHNWSDNGVGVFNRWENLSSPPGGLSSSPSAVSWGFGRIDVFARGNHNALWHKWFDGRLWSGWQSLGGVLISAPAVTSWAGGRLDVFAIGLDHAIWHLWYDFGWSRWESRGGYATFDPTAASWAPGRIDLFTVGSDSCLWHSWYGGAQWSPWASEVGGTWSSGPAAVAWGPGRLDVFGSSAVPSRPMIHAWYASGWHAESRGGALSSAPAAVSWRYDRLDVFVKGTDNHLWRDTWAGP